MALLWRIFSVFLVYAAAQHPTEIKVDLGQNLTLNCSISVPTFYWYMEIHSQFKGCIVHVVNNASETRYWVNTSISKYEVINVNQLVIKNITAEDCRLYFCGRRLNNAIHFKDTFRVVSDVPITPPANDSQANHTQSQHVGVWHPVISCSFALNAIAVLIGLVFVCLCLKRKNCKHKGDDPSPSPSPCENAETQESPQYEEIQLSPYISSPAAPPSECIYYKAQRPQSIPPQQ